MKSDEPTYYNIQTLASKTGISRRTVRYYVQRGLLQKPEGGGRGHYYTDKHLKRVETIQRWRTQGVPLEKMKQLLADKELSRKELDQERTVYRPVDKKSLRTVEDKILLDTKLPSPVRKPYSETHEPDSETTQWTKITIGSHLEVSFKSDMLNAEDQKAIKEFILSLIVNK